jgi:hypothetical protein
MRDRSPCVISCSSGCVDWFTGRYAAGRQYVVVELFSGSTVMAGVGVFVVVCDGIGRLFCL